MKYVNIEIDPKRTVISLNAPESDDEEQNLIKPAVDYIIQHDKEELLQLINRRIKR